jgi:hypothetical protein
MPSVRLPGQSLIIGGLVGALWFGLIGGWAVVNPGNLDWVTGDRAQHLLGWLFFRGESLGFPLGRIESLLHPVGTTVGFTDANPLVSLLLKPFSAWLPVDFQFIGAWLLLSFVLQGVFAFRIMELLTSSVMVRVLATVAFVSAPVLADRMGHDTLTAHWLLLGMIWLHLRPGITTRGTFVRAAVFNFVAAAVHPYLAVMVLALTLSLLIQLSRDGQTLTPVRAAAYAVMFALEVLAIFVLLGYVGGGAALAEGGFGEFSSDVLAMFNPMRDTLLLPRMRSRSGQHEGFAFLGTGLVLLLVILAGTALLRRQKLGVPSQLRPLVITALLMWVFALSDVITVAGHVVLTMRKLYDPLSPVVNSFRSGGRFVWPLYYLVITGTIFLAVSGRVLSRRVGIALLAAALPLQAVEATRITYFSNEGWPRVGSPVWESLDSTYRHLVLVPPVYPVGPPACDSAGLPYEYRDIVRASYLAYRNGLTMNSAYVARAPAAELEAYCRTLADDVAARRFAYDTVYIVAGRAMARFLARDSGATCATLDGFLVCVSDTQRGRFHQQLRAAYEAETTR